MHQRIAAGLVGELVERRVRLDLRLLPVDLVLLHRLLQIVVGHGLHDHAGLGGALERIGVVLLEQPGDVVVRARHDERVLDGLGGARAGRVEPQRGHERVGAADRVDPVLVGPAQERIHQHLARRGDLAGKRLRRPVAQRAVRGDVGHGLRV